MFSAVDFYVPLSVDSETFNINNIQTWHDLDTILKERSTAIFFTSLYEWKITRTFTASGMVVSRENAINIQKFREFVGYFKHIPVDVAVDIYFYGIKNNAIDVKVKEALANNKLWPEGHFIVESLLTVINGKWTFCSMVFPFGNVELSGKPQFKRQLRNLIANHHLFPADILDLCVTSGERIIHLFKAVMAISVGKYAPDTNDPAWVEVNLALLREIIATNSDKKSKALGQRVLCGARIFADANGADTEEMPINGLNASNLHRAGINAMKQAIAYALRCAQDPEFFDLVLALFSVGVSIVESAIHGAHTDNAFGGLGAVRVQRNARVTIDKNGIKTRFFNAMGKGIQLIELLLEGSLRGTVFDIDMKPTDESGKKANPDFWYKVVDIIVCEFLV